MKGLELLKFATSNNLNAMTFSLEELKEIEKELDQLEELKEENQQLKINIRKSDAAAREDSKFIFNEYCRLDEKHQELKKEYNALMTDYDEKDLECIKLEKENQELRKKANKYDLLAKEED